MSFQQEQAKIHIKNVFLSKRMKEMIIIFLNLLKKCCPTKNFMGFWRNLLSLELVDMKEIFLTPTKEQISYCIKNIHILFERNCHEFVNSLIERKFAT